MRLNEILSTYRGRSTSIVEIGEHTADLGALLELPEDVRYERSATAPKQPATVDPGTLVIAAVGPHSGAGATHEALAALAGGLPIGGRAVVVATWPTEDLAIDAVCGPLADGGCQVIAAEPLEPAANLDGATCLVVERVDRVTPVRAGLGRSEDRAGRPGELRDGLYAASGFVIEGVIARSLRQRLGKALSEARGFGESSHRVDELEHELVKQRAKVHSLQGKLATLQSSVRLRIGTMAVRSVRHPIRAVVDVPRELVDIRRHRRAGSQAAPAPRPAGRKTRLPAIRTVPLALPRVGRGHTRSLLTMTVPSHMFVPRTLSNTGLAGYEPAALACYLTVLDAAGPGTVLDIGANIGIYAGLASAFSDREVYAFEPMPQLADEARNFAIDNGLAFRTESVALGAENGEATFYLSDSTDSSNSLAEGFRPSSRQIQVKVQTLDDYVAQTGIRPAIMKIDTETTEPDVLAGATETIAKCRPWILCEVLAGRVETRLTEVLTPLGYHWYHINGNVPYAETNEIVGDPTHEHLMWLFAPERPSEDFWSIVRDMATAVADCTPARGAELHG